MSTPLRLIGSPRNIVSARHFTPTNSLLRVPSGEPWTPDSLCPLTNTPSTSGQHCQSVPQSLPPLVARSQQSEALEWKERRTNRLQGKGARRLPWSDGGKHACKNSVGKEEILAEPLPHYPSFDTPDRKELMENIRSGEKLSHRLGKGTFGVVYAAMYHGKLVAGKISTPHPKALKHFMNESHAIGLHHPNIVSIIKVVLPTNCSNGIVLMEHVMGCSLQKLLDLGSDFQSHRKRVKYSLQIATALEYCHNHSILHLDVKPKNVLVHHFLQTCKLCDFGCSSVIGEEKFSIQGTVQYVAPELLRGEMPTSAADVYSLAITMWQLSSREYPYEGEGEHSIIYKVVKQAHRPTIPAIQSTEDELYFSLVQTSWCQLPKSRLKIEQVVNKLTEWLSILENVDTC